MNNKIISAILSVLFFLFAYVQLNDPDGWKWVVAYVLPAILFGLLVFDIAIVKVARVLVITYSCIALLYLPDFFGWLMDGLPSIVETMRADKPYVEFVREFLGLGIVIAALVYYVKKASNVELA